MDFFGWQEAIETGAKRLIITEGEDDAVAGKRILDLYTKEEFKEHQPAVVSLPHGSAAAANDLTRLLPKIKQHFKEISFCFDMDKSGEKATEECCKVCPEATVIALPKKDLNECLKNGCGKAAFKALVFNAKKKKNTRLVFATNELHMDAREPARFGELTYPWKDVQDRTRGVRLGETIYIGAGVKMGKSEILNALAAHFIKVDGVKVFMAKPEEANKKTYKLMAGKMVGRIFHDPKVEFDYDAYDKAGKMLEGNLCMVNLYQHMGWETLKGDIYAAAGWGAKAIFIDPITNLTNGMQAADANVKLQEIAQELAAIALDLNVVVFIFCHLKANEGNISQEAREKKYSNGKYINIGNCPHEQGGVISSAQFAGSRAMMRSCNYMFALAGNKDPALPDNIRNVRRLCLLEDREFGQAGEFDLYWNNSTTIFEEC